MDKGDPRIRHGHPRFYKLLDEMSDIHDRKNRDYAYGGKATGNFDRVAQAMNNYPNIDWAQPEMVAIVYMLKQLDAYLWMKNSGHQSVTGEGVQERLKDIAIYTGIIFCIEGDKHAASCSPTAETESPKCDPVPSNRLGQHPIQRISPEREGQRNNPTPHSSPGLYFTERPSTFGSSETSGA